MMRLSVYLSCLSCLLMVACRTVQPSPTPKAVGAVHTTPTRPAVLPATETPVPATEAVVSAAVVTPTAPATSTSAPTNTPTTTATPLPAPKGHIYFLWDSKPLPQSGIGLDEPIQSLYLAVPRVEFGDWLLEPIVEEIHGWPYIQLSPDKTKLLLTVLEDKNGDGYVSDQGYDRGFDGPNIFLYMLEDGAFERVTSDFPIVHNPSWLDNQTIVYGQSTVGISLLDTQSGETQIARTFPEQTRWLNVSPDGRFLALNFHSVQISIFDIQAGTVVPITNEIGGFGVEVAWSPQGMWLYLGQPFTKRYFVVTAETFTVRQIPEPDSILFPAWSPSSQQMAFVQEVPDGTNLLLLDPVDLTTRTLLHMPGGIYNLLWSPNGSELAMVVTNEEKSSLVILDMEAGVWRERWQTMGSKRFYISTWSPDGKWLLLFDGQGWSPGREDEAHLYMIHKDAGDPVHLLESSGAYDPYGFYWVSEKAVP